MPAPVAGMAHPTYQDLLDENPRFAQENRQLRQENQRLRDENRQLRLRVDALEAQVLKPTQLLEQAQRATKRQAVPFSKGPPKENPRPKARQGLRH